MNKPSWLKDAIATPRGFVNKSGELLKARRMTQAQIDEFNGAKAAPAPHVEEVVEVAAVEEAVDLSKKTKSELIDMATEAGIDTEGLTKAQLVEALS